MTWGSAAATEPYLSVVVTTRNDDHGGDPLTRLQAFVNCFDEQCRRTGLDAEVIIVEWNPPADRPTIDTLLRIPEPSVCTYRFVEVPPDLHDTLQYADVLPLFQMIAKNVGIRRARGRFVLATNIDIIFSNELIEFIASGQLQPGVMYRVDRHDIESALPIHAPLDVLMKYCAEHQLRVHARWGSCVVDPEGRLMALLEDIVDGSTVRLGSGWHVREGDAASGFYRWATGRAQVHVDPAAAPTALAAASLEIELEPNPHDPTSPVQIDIIDHDDGTTARPTITRRGVFRLPLQDCGRARTLELRVRAAANDGRRPLAVFERRGDMQYVVRSITLKSGDGILERETFSYPADGWVAAPGAMLEARVGDDVSVVTSPRRWSYGLQYGPLRAFRRGTYRFVVRAEVLDGALSVGVMAGHQRSWLPCSVDHVRTTRGDILTVSVSLESGDRFWLMLSNDHPDAEGSSRFVVKELTGSAEFGAVFAGGRGSATARSEQRPHDPRDTPDTHDTPVQGLQAVQAPADSGRAGRDSSPQAGTDAAMAVGELSDDHGERPGRTTDSKVRVADRRFSREAQALLARIERRKRDKQAAAQHALRFPADAWRAGSHGVTLRVEHEDTVVSVVTERRKWSYCLEQGPLSAPATGNYRFELDCQVLEGGGRLGILSGDKRSWLPSESAETIAPDGRTLSVSARLRSGQAFWLVLYNDHPDGDGESRLLVRRVTASVDVRDALSIVLRAVERACTTRIAPRELLPWRVRWARRIQRAFRPTAERHTVIAPKDAIAYAMDGWRAADSGARDQRVQIDDGRVSATTAKEKWSYCLEYGPIRAAATGTYQFSLAYALADGGIALGVLSGDRKKWLRSSSAEGIAADLRRVTVSVTLSASQLCWLIISNNHPDGEGISRFTVEALTSAFAPINRRERWMNAIRRLWTGIESRTIAVRRRTVETIAASGRLLIGLVPVARVHASVIRLRDRLRRRIVNNSPEYKAIQENCRALGETVQQLSRLRDLDRFFKLLQDRRPEALHLNGCGDFQLMAREHWFELRGYPEFHTFSMNIDGLFSSMACYAGITERALESPYHIYHIEHEVGSGWSPEGEAVLRRRIADRGITWIDSKDVFVWSAYMHWLRRPMIFNTSDWGFGASRLAERAVEARQGVQDTQA